jgi:hypothetical protein
VTNAGSGTPAEFRLRGRNRFPPVAGATGVAKRDVPDCGGDVVAGGFPVRELRKSLSGAGGASNTHLTNVKGK